jgi:hypothetical protein
VRFTEVASVARRYAINLSLRLLMPVRPHVGFNDSTSRAGSRDRGRDLEIPIVILSELVDESQHIIGLELGVDDYVIKPFSPGELLARIRAGLRRSRAQVAAILRLEDALRAYRVADWELNVRLHRLRFPGGQHVRISKGEFSLLCTFLAEPHRIASRISSSSARSCTDRGLQQGCRCAHHASAQKNCGGFPQTQSSSRLKGESITTLASLWRSYYELQTSGPRTGAVGTVPRLSDLKLDGLTPTHFRNTRAK